ncbi:FAH family protein [Leptospira fainei serovar Hurstbridge str. BUT 6]|uniref:FAH family protein n=1 Tax=Leptospira fainei serovar Hurstbridge str. BUT 6 TaxID=1193011 RepID=S3VZI8_9LEPT|nr:fumarylacetoacetate hydrolase family protein [Leptospira fainei]EPG73497.1 FAH family protein [Leptospira fainei serovar Hurstbridge str. BUT 6]
MYRICKFESAGLENWGLVQDDSVIPIRGNHITDFIDSNWKVSVSADTKIPLQNIRLLSPFTPPCNVICQGKNYIEHIKETGMSPDDKDYNLFFMKANSSLSPAVGKVVRPKHVQLLDYEVEMALIIRKPILNSITVTEGNLHEYVAGITLANDISARDIQIPQGQWFKGKSYRTFCPVGPYVVLLDREDFKQVPNLRITLKVNGEIRQDSYIRNMIFSPAETLTELSGIMNLYPGDLVLTGTPSGVALKAPGGLVKRIASLLLSEKKMMKIFVQKQLEINRYLKDEDQIEATLRTEAGTIDTGVIKLKVTAS